MTNVLSKLREKNFYLISLNAKKIDKSPKTNNIDVRQNISTCILTNDEKVLKIRVTIETHLEPEALFYINTEHIIEFAVCEPISKQEIEENINDLIYPITADNSSLISTLTYGMINHRVVLPPAQVKTKGGKRENSKMTIGERIKKRRKELGMSVDKLADILGKNRATIYRYESDEIENLPISILEPLAKALHTTPAYLMGWTKSLIFER